MRTIGLVLLICLLSLSVNADDEVPAEIDYLLRSIGSSDCTFIRNGKRYDSDTAEEHLRIKYRNGKRYAPTAEKFSERLASKSYLSKRPYYIECNGEKTPSADWLTKVLISYSKD